MKQCVIVIPGLFSRRKFFDKLVRKWQENGIKAEIFRINWFSKKENYFNIQRKLLKRVNELKKKNKLVTLIGTSGGGTFTFSVLAQRINKLHKLVLVCSPLTEENSIRVSLGKSLSSVFKESLRICRKRKDLVSISERKNILIVIPRFDELVPISAMKLAGAEILEINTKEHFKGINFAMKERFGQIC